MEFWTLSSVQPFLMVGANPPNDSNRTLVGSERLAQVNTPICSHLVLRGHGNFENHKGMTIEHTLIINNGLRSVGYHHNQKKSHPSLHSHWGAFPAGVHSMPPLLSCDETIVWSK
jgi:hypothetical protein